MTTIDWFPRRTIMASKNMAERIRSTIDNVDNVASTEDP